MADIWVNNCLLKDWVKSPGYTSKGEVKMIWSRPIWIDGIPQHPTVKEFEVFFECWKNSGDPQFDLFIEEAERLERLGAFE